MKPIIHVSLLGLCLIALLPHDAAAICGNMPVRLPPKPRSAPPASTVANASTSTTPPTTPGVRGSVVSTPQSHTNQSRTVKLHKSSGMTSKVVSKSGGYEKPSTPPGSTAAQASAASKRAAEEPREPDAVTWAYSIDDAQVAAKEENAPYAIYFCSEDAAKIAGEGDKARDVFSRKNENVPSPTIFDDPAFVDVLAEAGIHQYAKVGATQINEATFIKYGVGPNTLLLCTYTGEVLATFAGVQCVEPTVTDYLKNNLFEQFSTWNRKQLWKAADDKKAKGQIITRIYDQRLYNTFQFSERVFSGARLWDEACFQALQGLSVRWIIQVGALPPDTELAKKYGIGCIHMPLQFGGITHQQALEFTRVVHDLAGGVYFYADDGKDRAPTAAAIACITLGDMAPNNAAAALATAGVDQKFKGLYQAAAAAKKTNRDEFFAFEPDFRTAMPAPYMNEKMATIQMTYDHIALANDFQWEIPEAWQAVDPVADVKTLLAQHEELAQSSALKAAPEDFQRALKEGEAACVALSEKLKTWKRGAAIVRTRLLTDGFARVTASCNTCHSKFRDNLAVKEESPEDVKIDARK